MFDHFGSSLTDRIENVTLIEPSSAALARATAVIECYVGNHRTVSMNMKLDELPSAQLQARGKFPHIHLLSNVLDIDGFNHFTLFAKMFQAAVKHTVLAVSHDRTFYGGSSRFEKLEEEIKSSEQNGWLAVESSNISRFDCANGTAAICWELHIEVLSGSV